MYLTLTEAAERAKMLSKELLCFIENDQLRAQRSLEDNTYRISAEDLETFLSKRSFETFWNNNDEAENAPVEKQSLAQSANLRRVLTAEAVAELKIQHQVLMSRVETLERLFSEFMEVEKTEKILVLEDAWQIETSGSLEKPTLPASDQKPSIRQNEDSIEARNAVAVTETDQITAEKNTIKEQAALEADAIKMNDAENSTKSNIESIKSKPENIAGDKTAQEAEKKDIIGNGQAEATPKSARDLLVKKLTNASKHRQATEESQAQEPVAEQPEMHSEADNTIAARLAEYERRLAEAKQTATQIWH